MTKCPRCGTQNLDGARLCRTCRKSLEQLPETTETKGSPLGRLSVFGRDRAGHIETTVEKPVSYKEIPNKLKLDYSHGIRDPTQRSLDSVQGLLAHFQKPQMSIDGLLTEAANVIWRQFGIDNVAIGLRDAKDGLYKYKAMVGFRDDALEGHKRIVYRKEQFFEDGQFIGTDISKYSRLYMAEDNVLTDEEKMAFNRPALLAMKRRTISESLEGDYVDVRIYGAGDDLLGWIEISGTRTMMLPDAMTIRWIETIASIIGAAIMCQENRKG